MKRIALAALIVLMSVAAAPMAMARDGVSVRLGVGGGGYYPYYGGYYSPYYYGYPGYYAPAPTVVYEQPAATEIITAAPAQPQQTTYVAPPAIPGAAAPSVPTFIDPKGRTCRQFQSVMDGAAVNGTACLQPDGSWRTVGE